MAKKKIFNDPIYGFISFPFDLIYDIIDHPYFQRLRRISQLGLSSYVYPGATHTRFHHAIGASYLCHTLIETLRSKGITISKEEYEATCLATLLHDIGHGPFSHALEYQMIDAHHEELTLQIMHLLNAEYEGKLDMSINIFTKQHPKKFLSQIISSQLDVDRMDYLNRDSFYTGVAEGKIGYERIIKMLTVHEGELVVESKGVHSIEKFLLSRYFMYRQVYLHKTSIAVEQMLKGFVKRYKAFCQSQKVTLHPTIDKLLCTNSLDISDKLVLFLQLDDSDIYYLLKQAFNNDDIVLTTLSRGILERKLHKTLLSKNKFSETECDQIFVSQSKFGKMDKEYFKSLSFMGQEDYTIYNPNQEIKIVNHLGVESFRLSSLSDLTLNFNINREYFLVYPPKTRLQ